MDEAQIRALFADLMQEQLGSAVAGVVDTLTQHFDSKIGQVKDELKPAVGEPEKSAKGKDATLDRISQLEARLEEEKKARLDAEQRQASLEKSRKFDLAFEGAFGQFEVSPELRGFLVDTLKAQLSDSELVGDKFVKGGKSLQEHLGEFMNSPVGKHFQPFKGQVNGADSRTTEDKPGTAQASPDGLEAFLSL